MDEYVNKVSTAFTESNKAIDENGQKLIILIDEAMNPIPNPSYTNQAKEFFGFKETIGNTVLKELQTFLMNDNGIDLNSEKYPKLQINYEFYKKIDLKNENEILYSYIYYFFYILLKYIVQPIMDDQKKKKNILLREILKNNNQVFLEYINYNFFTNEHFDNDNLDSGIINLNRASLGSRANSESVQTTSSANNATSIVTSRELEHLANQNLETSSNNKKIEPHNFQSFKTKFVEIHKFISTFLNYTDEQIQNEENQKLLNKQFEVLLSNIKGLDI